MTKEKPFLKYCQEKSAKSKSNKGGCFWNSAVDVRVSLSTVCLGFPWRNSQPIWCFFLPLICWLGFNLHVIMQADPPSSYIRLTLEKGYSLCDKVICSLRNQDLIFVLFFSFLQVQIHMKMAVPTLENNLRQKTWTMKKRYMFILHVQQTLTILHLYLMQLLIQ